MLGYAPLFSAPLNSLQSSDSALTLSLTQGAATLSASASVSISAQAPVSQAGNTLSALATANISAVSITDLAAATLLSSGAALISASVTQSQASFLLLSDFGLGMKPRLVTAPISKHTGDGSLAVRLTSTSLVKIAVASTLVQHTTTVPTTKH
jgi:hypothetical protein